MLLRFETESVGEALGGIRRWLEDGFNHQDAAHPIRLQCFRHGIGHLFIFRLIAEASCACLALLHKARLQELPQSRLDRGRIAPDDIVYLLHCPIGERFSLQYLQDFKLLDTLYVIAEELSDDGR